MTYLIIGSDSESIKEEIARLISRLWNKKINKEVLEIRSADIHTITTENINSIGIEDIKRLQKEMIFTPYSESVQVALIFNADKLTEEAQNSFLKTLEESNNNTAYILTTSNEKNLLPTIISRSLKVYAKDISVQDSSKGVPKTLTKNLIDAFKDIEKIAKDKDSTDNFLNEVELYYQALLKQNLKDKEQLKQIYDNIQCVEKTRRRINANGNRRLLLENLFLVLRGHSSS